MPGKLFYRSDRDLHVVREMDFQELSKLPIEPGPNLVIAKGTVGAIDVLFEVKIGLRLEVHGMFAGLIDFDETSFFTAPASLAGGGVLAEKCTPDTNSFMLVVAANLPFEGGAGSGPPPPPHRAVPLARKESFGDGLGVVTNVKITSFPFDEIIVAT
jgi:hypothetical protein